MTLILEHSPYFDLIMSYYDFIYMAYGIEKILHKSST